MARATARLLPPRTALLFPGQGIQRQGMGMEGYARSAAARAVWDRADACTRDRLGFSILRVVRENPKTLLMNGETHRHPEGVLHLTRFTQPAMAVLAMAQVAELREAGVLAEDAIACGHSVGEYNALAAVFEVLPLEAVVEIVYQRGAVMHRFVPRDAAGRSPYAMGVIRPNLAGLDQAGAQALVDEIARDSGRFLQIVNYNVRDRQYAVTGHVDALERLAAHLAARSSARRPAYVPVPGVDVPFHSAVLRDGVDAFRATLEARLPASIDPARLVDRYVPNLVARPFRLEPAFAEAMLEVTDSPAVRALLDGWDEAARDPAGLARALLVELLAWQFASPVRWIETQELLVAGAEAGGLAIERALEVGVGYQPTVANMFRQTLEGLGRGGVLIQNVEADAALVLARDEDAPDEPIPAVASPVAPAAAPTPAAPAPAAPAPVIAEPGPAVADQPISTAEALKTLLALQARVRPEQIRDDETIDGLFEGVSSRRNQVLLDLGVEFEPGTLDAAHEVPIATLATELARRARRYSHPGPYLQAAQDEALRRVLGRAGLVRKDAVAHLEATWGAGPGQIGGVLDTLALEARDGASGRGGALGALADAAPTQRADALAALDQAVEAFGRRVGRPLARRSAAGSAGGTVDAAAVAALEDRIVGADGVLLQSARDLAARLGHPFPQAAAPAGPHPDTLALAALEAEHGAGYAELIAPRFDARKHLPLLDNLAFARRDLARLYHAARRGHDVDDDAARLAPWVQAAPAVAATATWYAGRARQQGDARLAALLDGLATRPASPRPLGPTRPAVEVTPDGRLAPREIPDANASNLQEFLASLGGAVRSDDPAVDARLRDASPFDFRGRTAVVSGASPGSIALEMVRALLRGGARVVVTTTTHTRARRRLYRQVFRQEAGPGAELHVVPANMASFTDVDALVDWLFEARTEQAGAQVRVVKPAFSPDLLLPFGALGDAATLDRLDARGLAALRVMLVGVERLIARVARCHLALGVPAGGCHVVLPLSPNHGAFGGDGAYAEAKAALEVLLTRWHSEHDAWGRAVTLCGARIGWVRGTGLMDANDAVAARLEAATGLRTFSTPEMGHLLAALCTDPVRQAAQRGRCASISRPASTPSPTCAPSSAGCAAPSRRRPPRPGATTPSVRPRRAGWIRGRPPRRSCQPPPGPREAPAAAIAWSATQADPRQQVVIVGFGEVGPCGSARTRFDLEVSEQLSAASILELAWMTGLVRYERDGFVDVESGEPVPEAELAGRYGDVVRRRAGIRWIEQGRHDPSRLPVHATVYLDRDFTFPVPSRAEAEAFAAADPEGTRVGFDARAETWTVTRRAGSEVKVLRHARLSRQVAGILPEGFDFSRFGVPADMVERVDPVALFNLIATVDAFRAAGLDPEELLAHVHPARVANTQGAGIGGMASLRRLYQDHILGNARQGDVLQETLINVAAAYVVQTYVGSYGAMSHPVGACATAAVSLEEGLDKILAGKAEVVVAGGFDDIGPEGAVGFADMDATADSDEMQALGLEPDELSRANDARRRGFVEAQGGGTLLLARGDVALRLGLPVYGVLAWAGSFGDGIQQSVPAPGMGALAAALGGPASPLGEALARHGLTADDVALVYKHDTSTMANDLNENALHHRMQTALGRTPGNPLFVVSQKTLTGHSKGGAAAWQVHGALQALAAGKIPGNRNLDQVDPAMAAYAHMAFTDETLESSEPLRAAVVTSLGFGHVSAVALVLHPEAFRASLDPAARAAWEAVATERVERGWRERAAVWMDEAPHFAKRQHRRFAAADGSRAQADEEAALLIDPAARFDRARGVFTTEPAP
ncbi:MAG: acyltransferase domain-containing protein [bacterium]